MSKTMFRPRALERLSSPEQLDQLLRVTSPRLWIGLLAVGALILTGIIWGALGRVDTRVSGRGILLHQGGLRQVVAAGNGPVTELLVGEGDAVTAGQLVVTIAQPVITESIRETQAKIALLEQQHATTADFGQQQVQLGLASLEQQRQSLQGEIAALKTQLANLDQQVLNERALFKEGLVTRSELLAAEQPRDQAQAQLNQKRNELSGIALKKVQTRRQGVADITTDTQDLGGLTQHLQSLQDDLQRGADIKSPCAGRVIEINVDVGDPVTAGIAVLTLEPAGAQDKIVLAAFFPAGRGKRITPGMTAQIAPLTAPQEEFGFIRAEVVSVADYPATTRGMMRILRNTDLVQELSSAGPPIEVRLKPVLDPQTPSGFKWSSSLGPHFAVTAGTLCSASVTIRQQPPISLVMPFLKRTLLGGGED